MILITITIYVCMITHDYTLFVELINYYYINSYSMHVFDSDVSM